MKNGLQNLKLWIFQGIMACAVLGLLTLGQWQWSRHNEKQALDALRSQNETKAPLHIKDLNDIRQIDPAGATHRAVSVEGRFEAEPTLFFYTQGPSGSLLAGPGRSHYSLFALQDGSRIFINRGFRPERDAAQAVPEPTTELVTIKGTLEALERPNIFTPPDSPSIKLLFLRNSQRMADMLGITNVAPWTVRMESPASFVVGTVLPKETQAQAHRHFGYALTWWGLAGVVFCMMIVYGWQQRTSNKSKT